MVASSVVCQLELFQLFSRRFASAAVDGRCGLYRNEKNSVCRGRGSVKFYRPTLYGGRQRVVKHAASLAWRGRCFHPPLPWTPRHVTVQVRALKTNQRSGRERVSAPPADTELQPASSAPAYPINMCIRHHD